MDHIGEAMGMTGLVVLTLLIVLMGMAVGRFGVDTRDGQDWWRRPPGWFEPAGNSPERGLDSPR